MIMGTFAQMAGNMVSNVVVADDKKNAEIALNCVLIEYTPENPAGIGWVYDDTTGRFTPPSMVE